jgi:hypothetical protein
MYRKLLNKVLLIGCLSVLSNAQLLAQPPNDDCINAQMILVDHQSNSPTITPVDLDNATTSVLEDCSQPGIWFKFIAQNDFYQITTTTSDGNCDNEDAEIHVFAGTNCGSLSSLMVDGCQDEDNTLCYNQESFRSFVSPGTMIWILVARNELVSDTTFNLEIDPNVEVPRSITVESCDFMVYNGTYTIGVTVNGYECYNKDDSGGSIFYDDNRLQFQYSKSNCEDNPKGGKAQKGGKGGPMDEQTIAYVSKPGPSIVEANPANGCLIIGNINIPIPTLSQWGFIILGIIVLLFGIIVIRKEVTAPLEA